MDVRRVRTQALKEESISRLKGERNAREAAREAREKAGVGRDEDFIPLDGKVRRGGSQAASTGAGDVPEAGRITVLSVCINLSANVWCQMV